MQFIADLHIHSHYSRATSGDLVPEQLAFWAQKKGITLVGSGDFTHPGWVAELKEKMVEAENGLFRLSPALEQAVAPEAPTASRAPVRFILTGEIKLIINILSKYSCLSIYSRMSPFRRLTSFALPDPA